METSVVMIIIGVFCVFVLGVSCGRYGTTKRLEKRIASLNHDLAYCEGVESTVAAYSGNSDSLRILINAVTNKIVAADSMTNSVSMTVNGVSVNVELDVLLSMKHCLREDLAESYKAAEKKYPEHVSAYILGRSKAESALSNLYMNPQLFGYLRFDALPGKYQVKAGQGLNRTDECDIEVHKVGPKCTDTGIPGPDHEGPGLGGQPRPTECTFTMLPVYHVSMLTWDQEQKDELMKYAFEAIKLERSNIVRFLKKAITAGIGIEEAITLIEKTGQNKDSDQPDSDRRLVPARTKSAAVLTLEAQIKKWLGKDAHCLNFADFADSEASCDLKYGDATITVACRLTDSGTEFKIDDGEWSTQLPLSFLRLLPKYQ